MKKAQFATEFLILLSFMFIAFMILLAVTTNIFGSIKEGENLEAAQDVASVVKEEIDLANTMPDGYQRTFALPKKLRGNNYSVRIIDNRELVVDFFDVEHVVFLPSNIVGNVSPGSIKISKSEGVVYLDSVAECNDAIDNDNDGLIDLSDVGCFGLSDNDETNCGDNVCEGPESCFSCSQDCGICPSPGELLFKNINNTVKFDDKGNVILKGLLETNSDTTPTSSDEFILKDGSSNIAIINLITGNMFIKGNLFENQETLSPSNSSNDFIVKNNLGNIIGYFDESGNLYLKGTLIENGNP